MRDDPAKNDSGGADSATGNSIIFNFSNGFELKKHRSAK
jgi:hypothetical protein